jgi:hypothetical protein
MKHSLLCSLLGIEETMALLRHGDLKPAQEGGKLRVAGGKVSEEGSNDVAVVHCEI